MNNTALYSKHNKIPKVDAEYVLEKYLKLLKSRSTEYVLDVGAGEGSVSFEVLLPRLPAHIKELVLCDISENMLKTAKNKCDDERIKFLQMDISSNISNDFYQHFDQIFSFYCLQWVTDETRQQEAIRNIFTMLKPGGGVLLTIIVSGPNYGVCEKMSASTKWAPYMKNVKSVISLYHYLEKPAEKLKHFMQNAGFCIHVCEEQTRFYTHSSFSDFLNFTLSINAFVARLSENERNSFIKDFEKELRIHRMVTVQNSDDGREKVFERYKILIACASKPKI